MKMVTNEMDAETDKWNSTLNDENNDIVKRAKNMFVLRQIGGNEIDSNFHIYLFPFCQVCDGLFNVSIHEGRRKFKDDSGFVHAGRIFCRRSKSTLQGREAVFISSGWCSNGL